MISLSIILSNPFYGKMYRGIPVVLSYSMNTLPGDHCPTQGPGNLPGCNQYNLRKYKSIGRWRTKGEHKCITVNGSTLTWNKVQPTLWQKGAAQGKINRTLQLLESYPAYPPIKRIASQYWSPVYDDDQTIQMSNTAQEKQENSSITDAGERKVQHHRRTFEGGGKKTNSEYDNCETVEVGGNSNNHGPQHSETTEGGSDGIHHHHQLYQTWSYSNLALNELKNSEAIRISKYKYPLKHTHRHYSRTGVVHQTGYSEQNMEIFDSCATSHFSSMGWMALARRNWFAIYGLPYRTGTQCVQLTHITWNSRDFLMQWARHTFCQAWIIQPYYLLECFSVQGRRFYLIVHTVVSITKDKTYWKGRWKLLQVYGIFPLPHANNTAIIWIKPSTGAQINGKKVRITHTS